MGDFGDRCRRSDGGTGGEGAAVQRSPGKRSLVEARYGVQRRAAPPSTDDDQVHAAAEAGLAQPASSLPHADRIQSSFGRHDVSGIQAHVGGAATAASAAMGAEAYATGDHVAFRDAPDLHTAAHEAAHVVQQRAGVSLKGGVGETGDPYEQHADAVADAVVAGRSAEILLDRMAPSSTASGTSGGVQRKNLKQAGLTDGLKEAGEGDLVSYTKKGKEYTEAVDETVANRTAALVKAAERSAVVGKRTTGKKWTEDNEEWNKEAAPTLDPFRFLVDVWFTDPDDRDKPHSLTLVYQHAKEWTGYVTSVEDSSNQGTPKVATMYRHDDEDPKKGKKRDTDSFSNIHDTTEGGSIAGQTEGDEEHSLDAYTKIAGEGARWQCVRKHASNVANTSLFFVNHSETEVIGVTFETLWKRWNKAFKKAYDIDDATVVAAIKTGKLKAFTEQPRKKTALTGADYDLEAGKTHGT